MLELAILRFTDNPVTREDSYLKMPYDVVVALQSSLLQDIIHGSRHPFAYRHTSLDLV